MILVCSFVFLCVISLAAFGMREVIASLNELERVPSCAIILEKF